MNREQSHKSSDILIGINARDYRDPWEPRPAPTSKTLLFLAVTLLFGAIVFFVAMLASAL